MTKHTACQRRPVLTTLCLMAMVLLVLGFEIARAAAADYSWANPVSGDFDGPTNWTPAGGPPGANDTAIFNLGSTGYTVSSTQPDTLQQLRVDNDTVTFNGSGPLTVTGTTLPAISFGNHTGDLANATLHRSLNGVNDAVGYAAGSQATVTLLSPFTWTDTNLYIGYAGQGTVRSYSTISSTNSMVLGYQTGSQGTVNQSGTSVLKGGSLIVGGSGIGTLNNGSATFNQIILGQNTGSMGAASFGKFLTEAGGNLIVGESGNGIMSLTGSGTVGAELVIGQNAGSQGTLSLTNSHSILTEYGISGESGVIVGGSGQGSLLLSNGATLYSGNEFEVGQSAGSVGEVNITGAKSLLDVLADSKIGDAGRGTLTVSAGGKVDGLNLSVAGSVGASGAVTVDGAGSSVISHGELTIAASGIGSLAITNGGSVDDDIVTTVGANASSQGSIIVDGAGSILHAGNLTTGGSGIGNIAVTAGGELDSGVNVIGRDQGSRGSISIDGAQSQFLLVGATIGQAGQGSLTLSGGSLTTASGNFVVGQATTGVGTLTVDGATATMQNLVVAQDGSGLATFSGGASVTAQNVTIGADKGASGSISITSSGTTFTGAALSIAPAGSGQLSASDGAALSATSVTIGGAGSLSLASGATLTSSNLTISPLGQLSLAGAGTKYSVTSSNSPQLIGGVVTISNGASWITPNAVIVGNLTVSPASVTVSGAGSQWNASSSFGSLTMATGSQLVVNNSGVVTASTIVDSGTISLDTGAKLSATNSLAVLGTLQVGTRASVITPSLMLFQGRTIDLSGGGTVTVGTPTPAATVLDSFTTNAAPSGSLIQIETGGKFTEGTDFTGSQGGTYAVTGSILNQGGTVTLQGAYPSPLNVSGDFTQQSGTLALLMGGAPYNAGNELRVAGNVSLSGVLELDFVAIQDYPLYVGATFDLIFAGGNFNSTGLTVVTKGVYGDALPAGFAYTTQFSDGVFSLTVTSVPEPSTLVLAGMCILGAALWWRRS